jgi:hypothetical protein
MSYPHGMVATLFAFQPRPASAAVQYHRAAVVAQVHDRAADDRDGLNATVRAGWKLANHFDDFRFRNSLATSLRTRAAQRYPLSINSFAARSMLSVLPFASSSILIVIFTVRAG